MMNLEILKKISTKIMTLILIKTGKLGKFL
jgi:hypothetical protein